MDITGTKNKIQRVIKVAEESYKKINEVIEKIDKLQKDLATTSEQVDHIERELAEQRALVERMAEQQGLDVEAVLADVEYPERLLEDEAAETDTEGTEVATSRPSATDADEQ
jgi:DNA anti-recombination protein RmuC